MNSFTYQKTGKTVVAVITKNELRANRTLTTDYTKVGGKDIKSLKLNCYPEQFSNAFKLELSRSSVEAKIFVLWDNLKLSTPRQEISLIVTGNNLKLEKTISIVFEVYNIKSADIQFVPKEQYIWGDSSECGYFIINGKNFGKQYWKYSGKYNISYSSDNLFYTLSDESHGVPSNSIHHFVIEPWESKPIPVYIKCEKSLNNSILQKFSFSVNSEKREAMINIVPFPPIITCRLELKKKIVELSPEIEHIATIYVEKRENISQDFQQLKIISSNDGISINNTESNSGEFHVLFDGKKFRTIPEQLQVNFTISAKNAPTATLSLILSKNSLNISNSIQIRKPSCLEFVDTLNKKTIFYIDKDYSKTVNSKKIEIWLRNNFTKQVTGINLHMYNNGVCFENGKQHYSLKTLSPGSIQLIPLTIKNLQESCTIEIGAEGDYFESLRKNIEIEALPMKATPLLCSFIPDENPAYVGQSYENYECGRILIKTGVLDQPLSAYKKTRIQVQLHNCNLLKIKETELANLFLEPGQKLELEVLLNGAIIADENSFSFEFIVNDKLYNGMLNIKAKEYNFHQLNIALFNDLIYPITEECICIGSFTINDPEKTKPFDSVGETILLEDPFYFEDEGQTLNMTNGVYPILFKAREFFNNVDNLDNTKEVIVKCILKSTEPAIEKEKVLGKIAFHPFEAKAVLDITFESNNGSKISCRNTPVNIGSILYTESQLHDKFLKVGTILFYNKTSIPYKDECVKFRGIEIVSDNNLITVENEPCEYIILNGEEPVCLPILLDWNMFNVVNDSDFTFKVKFIYNGQERFINFEGNLAEERLEGIVSIDLGTTGIVCAKLVEDIPELIILKDAEDNREFNIESDDEIISSISIIESYNDEAETNRKGRILLSPTKPEYKMAKHVIIPSKFVVGQSHIPYLEKYKNDYDSLLFGKEGQTEFNINEPANLNYLNPQKFVEEIYQDIFNRMQDKGCGIRKLIVTYPNTYTPELLTKLRDIIVSRFKTLKNFVYFVPESDAVVAYYIDKRINGSDGNFTGFKTGEEKIVIYDMGAGTLDLSYVVVLRQGRSVTATIERKIGIPIAGNYLDYLLYDRTLKKSMKENPKNKDYKDAKDFVMAIKKDFPMDLTDSQKKINWNLDSSNVFSNKNNSDTYQIFDNAIKEYLYICGDLVFKELLGDIIPDTIVLSGRGCQFAPLQNAINKYAEKVKANVQALSDNATELKTCVAIGALIFNQTFYNDKNYEIRTHNQYSRLGVVYFCPSEEDVLKNVVKYAELINPNDGNWSDSKQIEGTLCREFENQIEIDLSVHRRNAYFIQSTLSDKEIVELYTPVFQNPKVRREDMRWAFVNELFCLNPSSIHYHNKERVPIRVTISKENTLTRKVGDRIMTDEQVIENVEKSMFYERSMWPFVEQ